MQLHQQQESTQRTAKLGRTTRATIALATYIASAAIFAGASEAVAQCYTDPLTGQRICSRPSGGYSLGPSGESGNVVSIDSTAHCRICVDGNTFGSGTLVEGNDSVGLLLTCAHLFDTSTTRIVVSFPNGKQFVARVVEVDRTNDLAALIIQKPSDIRPLVCEECEPAGLLAVCGFGQSGTFRSVRGAITGHSTTAGSSHLSTTIAGAVRPGDSGGAVLNTHGHVVGVVWGVCEGQTYATCGAAVGDFLTRIRAKVFGGHHNHDLATNEHQPQAPGPQPNHDAWLEELDARLRALDAKKQDKGDYLRPGDLNGYLRAEDAGQAMKPLAKQSDVEREVGTLAGRFESVHSIALDTRQRVEQLAAARGGFLHGMSLGKIAVGALGLSGPVAAAVVIAGGLMGRRIKSRVKERSAKRGARGENSTADNPQSEIRNPKSAGPRPSTLDHTPIAIDSPPPPQRTVPETHFVSVEKDTFAKAHQWASEHVARKYPGATEVLAAQESLIKQYIAGR